METITWHENMYEYFRDLSHRKHCMGYRIDPLMRNDALMHSEREYANKHYEYLNALNIRYNLT